MAQSYSGALSPKAFSSSVSCNRVTSSFSITRSQAAASLGRCWLFLKAKPPRSTYLVIDLYKVKTARRRDRPAGVPIAGFEGLLEVALRPPPIAHELQGADHRAYLVMQK